MELLMTQLTGAAEGGRDAGRGGDGGKATAGGWGHVPGPQRTIGLHRAARRWRVCLFKYELCLGYPLARPPPPPPPTAPRYTPNPPPPHGRKLLAPDAPSSESPHRPPTIDTAHHREIPRFCTRKINKQTLHVHT